MVFPLQVSSSAPCTVSVSDPEDYDILKQIGRGSRSIVYLARCKRGRLRNRQVALKKFAPLSSDGPRDELSHPSYPSALHQALHHPAVVSLLSSFSTSSYQFHVLELCSGGTLTEFLQMRHSHVLSEGELRGVVKSITNALLYLQNELVVHGDIKPANILLTEDYRIKLTNFSLATRLSSMSREISHQHSLHDGSPEMLSATMHSGYTDQWSLGCLMVECLSGIPPFGGNRNVLQASGASCTATYTLPDNISFQAKDLIANILQIDSTKRIPLHQLMSHPFFDSDLFVPLSASPNPPPTTTPPALGAMKQSGFSPLPSDIIVPKQSAANSLFSGRKLSLGNNVNVKLPSFLCREGFPSTATGPMRRIVSDPLPVRLPSLASEWAALYPNTTSSRKTPSLIVETSTSCSSMGIRDKNLCQPLAYSPLSLLSCPLKPASPPHASILRPQRDEQVLEQTPDVYSSVHKLLTESRSTRTGSCDPRPALPSPVPIISSIAKPYLFNTSVLSPQTRKTIHGQVVVLPSRSLLVDFREGERRRGKQGHEVFIVNPEGTEVRVYNAPHLSTPCCLAEPTAVYSTSNLPSGYLKQYKDAGCVVEQIKQKTPKLVVYRPKTKCTLMANTPLGDVEIICQSYAPAHHSRNLRSRRPQDKGDTDAETASVRIRLFNNRQLIEIARFIPGPQGDQWTKKQFVAKLESLGVEEQHWKELTGEERQGLHHLLSFLQQCEKLDDSGTLRDQGSKKITDDPNPKISMTFLPLDPVSDGRFHAASPPETASSPVNLRTLPSNITPAIPRQHSGGDLTKKSDNPGSEVQTRFIPSVGWCVRYGSGAFQGGRYRIMFLDGVALDIDVDEEKVEFTSKSGDITRHNIRDCNSKRETGDRMKVFEEFVSMFDERPEDDSG